MDNNISVPKAHSEEYFGEYRDFWWNLDFLELMVQRLKLENVKNVLDLGCGIGHWGQLLAKVLNEDFTLTGLDLEASSISKAQERALQRQLNDRFQYQVGDVNSLPFKDNSFDLVTCQTLLIHLSNPKLALKEMLRVVKPSGLLLIAEPNNFANASIADSLTQKLSIDEIMDNLRFDLTLQRGKQALGLGYNSEGDFIPGYLADLGAREIQVYISDKATPFYVPYDFLEQQVHIKQMTEWSSREFLGWDKAEMKTYFLAGGGNDQDFERLWAVRLKNFHRILEEIKQGSYHTAGGVMQYIISAQKS